ncbi:MAG: antitoxin VbhA family protein [Bryobacteraceae bacterium]
MAVVAVEAKQKISAAEMERRREAVQWADAHNRIEGQFPSPQSDEVFEAFIRGEIEQSEILPRLQALFRQP